MAKLPLLPVQLLAPNQETSVFGWEEEKSGKDGEGLGPVETEDVHLHREAE